MDYAVITDNEIRVSGYTYDNKVGDHYTFPHKYKSWLKEGTLVVYYKSKQQRGEQNPRLSEGAHYFGVAKVDQVYYAGKHGNNNMYVAMISDYHPFQRAVPFRKPDGGHYEHDSTDWDIQTWRNGVRQIDEEVYRSILQDSGHTSVTPLQTTSGGSAEIRDEYSSVVFEEGRPLKVYSTRYERNPRIRDRVLAIKGYRCCVCGFDFEETYGALGHEFIHVHHNKPLYQGQRRSEILSDFDVVCPNCHAMLHRQPGKCLTVEELKVLFDDNR